MIGSHSRGPSVFTADQSERAKNASSLRRAKFGRFFARKRAQGASTFSDACRGNRSGEICSCCAGPRRKRKHVQISKRQVLNQFVRRLKILLCFSGKADDHVRTNRSVQRNLA